MSLREREVLQPDDAPSENRGRSRHASLPNPVVCYFIIGASAFMFFIGDKVLPGLSAQGYPLPPGTLVGPLTCQGEWWRALSYAFEHGGILHLVLNMSVVWTLGFTLERFIGPSRFVALSIVTCLGSAAMAILFAYRYPTVGASGMILGWAGAMLPLSTQQGRRSLGIWLAQVAVLSFLPGVSWQGHLGGFLAGLPCGFALRKHSDDPFGAVWLALLLGGAASVYFACALQR